jgi:hypothetical protein
MWTPSTQSGAFRLWPQHFQIGNPAGVHPCNGITVGKAPLTQPHAPLPASDPYKISARVIRLKTAW